MPHIIDRINAIREEPDDPPVELDAAAKAVKDLEEELKILAASLSQPKPNH